MEYIIKACKTKAAYSVKPKKKTSLDFAKIKQRFPVELDAGISLVLDIEGGIILHNYGEMIFKKLKDEKRIAEIAEEIYNG